MADPTELAAIKELVAEQGMELDARVAPMSSIEQTFDLESELRLKSPHRNQLRHLHPHRNPRPSQPQKLRLKKQPKKTRRQKASPLRRRYRMDDLEAVVDVVNDILTDAIEYDVSDIHIEPYRKPRACAGVWTALCRSNRSTSSI